MYSIALLLLALAFPTSQIHSAPLLKPTRHHSSQPGRGGVEGVTSEGQEIILCHSREGRGRGGISQQLGRAFATSGHERFVMGANEQMFGALRNTSISQEISNLG